MTGKAKILSLALIIVAIFLAAGCASEQPVTTQPPPAAAVEPDQPLAPPSEQTMRVTAYFASKDALYLVPEVRMVRKTSQPAHAAVESLLSGPTAGSELVGLMPEGTKLLGLEVKDHIAYVNFSDKLVKNNKGGSTTEMLLVGAIVNTLTEFSDIHKVQILVEGKKVETLTGHMDVGEPLSRSEGVIKKPETR